MQEPSPEQALDELLRGNRRFTAEHREEVPRHAAGQRPAKMGIGCMDSRVPLHIVFKQGLGEMFAQATPGNVVTNTVRGGAAYAALHGTKVIVVLGHTGCGAVGAAFEWAAHDKGIKDHDLLAVAQLLRPSVDEAVKLFKAGKMGEQEAKDYAAELNVKRQVDALIVNATVEKAAKEGSLVVVGGLYDIKTGEVKEIVRVGSRGPKLLLA